MNLEKFTNHYVKDVRYPHATTVSKLFRILSHSKPMSHAHPTAYYKGQSRYLNADMLINIDDGTTIAKFNSGITLKFMKSQKW